MLHAWNGLAAQLRRSFRLVVLFCVLRFVVGIGAIVVFERDSIAWGYELTAIVLAMLAVYVLVALAVRRWAPPCRS